ncbi:hypothetical protein J2P12_06290, partial [Candidatus Bathyarchaeota archaeon]|nr:hypothetical protein [Candidatus Bathyarchaeota archaeon]
MPGARTHRSGTILMVLGVILIMMIGSIGQFLPGMVNGSQKTPRLSSPTKDASQNLGLNWTRPTQPVPDLHLPGTVLSSVDKLLGTAVVTQDSSQNLTIRSSALKMRLLGGSMPLDYLLFGAQALSSISWSIQTEINNSFVVLHSATNNFTVSQTPTGPSITRISRVSNGNYTGLLQTIYSTNADGSVKWNLRFSPDQSGDYKLVFSWSNITSDLSLSTVSKQLRVNYGLVNYVLDWSDIPASLNATTNLVSGDFRLSVALGVIIKGATVSVDPTIASNVNEQASALTFQRHVFYDPKGGNYWVFYNDGSGISYRYSSDGSNWSGAYSIPGWPSWVDYSASSTSVLNTGSTVIVASGQTMLQVATPPWTGSVSFYFVQGTISGNSISWNQVQTSATFQSTCNNGGASCEMLLEIWFANLGLSSDGSTAFSYNLIIVKDVSGGDYYNSTLLVDYKGSMFNLATTSGSAASFFQAYAAVALDLYRSVPLIADSNGG